MNENENNFESLRRLLVLKRHETPPPGYFENFSREVTARIRAGDAGQAESASSQLPWLFRLLSAFETKPAFAGVFASGLCMLLLVGIVYAERPDVTLQPLLQQTAQVDNNPLTMPTAVALNTMRVEQPALIPISSSTNPVFNSQSGGSLFASEAATVQQVNFTLPGY